MSSEALERAEADFLAKVAPLTNKLLLLALDYSLASAGVVDLLLDHIRSVERVTAVEKAMIRGAAVYLARSVLPAWEQLAENVSLVDESQGAVLRASGGRFLENEAQVEIRIEQTLLRLLTTPPSPFPVGFGAFRAAPPNYDTMSMFARGMWHAASPFSYGPWAQLDREQGSQLRAESEKHIATSLAAYAARVFPTEPLGQRAELYLAGLCDPWFEPDGESPGVRSMQTLVQYLREKRYSMTQIELLARNLAMNPNEQVSAMGLVLISAIVDEGIPTQIFARAQALGMYVARLRPAMLATREAFGLEADWTLAPAFRVRQAKRFLLESHFGYLPWLRIPQQRLYDPKVMPLVHAIASLDLEESLSRCAALVEVSLSDVDIRLQKLSLEALMGDFDRVHQEYVSLSSEPGAEKNPMLFEQWGLCDIERGEMEEAVSHLEFASASLRASTPFQHRYANNYSWALILNKNYEEALEILNLAVALDPCPLQTLLNRAFVQAQLDDFEAAKVSLSLVFKLAPLDRRVISSLMRREILAE